MKRSGSGTRFYLGMFIVALCFCFVPRSILAADVTVADVSVAENGTMTFTATLNNGPVAGGFTVDVLFAGLSATGGGTDFTSTTQNLTFVGTDGETQQFTVPLTTDTIVEEDENLTVSMANILPSASADISDTATGTITDDDSTAVTIADVSVSESGSMTFTATLSNAVEDGFSVNLNFSDVTATGGGVDYTSTAKTLTFAGTAGETEQYTVPLATDNVVEATETFTVSMGSLSPVSAPGGSITVSDTATGTITDDDSTAVTIADVSVAESGSMTFTATLSNAVENGFSVDLNFSDVTATGGGVDYTSTAKTLTFAGTAGETEQYTVPLATDSVVEATETFTVSMGSLSPVSAPGGSITVSDTATGTITDDDSTAVTIADVSVSESGSMTFTATLSNAVEDGFSVNLNFSDVTATGGGVDYTSTAETLIFAGTAGETKQYAVPLNTDNIIEATETFTVSMGSLVPVSAPGGVIDITDTATGNILDDDTAQVSINANDPNADEELSDPGQFTVTQSKQASVNTVISYTVASGGINADNGTDYTLLPGSITIPAGSTTATIDVAVVDDAIVEPNETVIITLNSISSGDPQVTINGSSDDATVNIEDNDIPTLSVVSDTNFSEGNGGGSTTINFTVTSNKTVAANTSIDFYYNDYYSWAGEDAEASDFAGSNDGWSSISGGTTASISIDISADDVVEEDETFFVYILNAAISGNSNSVDYLNRALNGSGGWTYAYCTILNDDLPQLSIAPVSIVEGNSGTKTGVFTVTSNLTVADDAYVNFDWAVSGSGVNPTEAGDLTGTLSGTSNINNTTTRQLNISVVGDTIVEDDETFQVVLSSLSITGSAGNASLGIPHPGIGTITNDDTANLSIDDVTVAEAGGNAVFTILSDKVVESPATVTIDYATSDGSASSSGASDFTATSNTATITASGTTAIVSVPITNDAIVERDETFAVNLTNPGGSVTPAVSDATGDGIITNDDIPALSISDVTDSEGTGANKTVNFLVTTNLEVASDATVSVDYLLSHSTTESGDFTGSTSGTLNISNVAALGTTNLPITFNSDAVVEKDESYTVTISNGNVQDSVTVPTLSDTIGAGGIENDDSPLLAINDVAFSEGDSGTSFVSFTVISDLSVADDQNLNFNYAISATGGEPTEVGDLTGTLSGSTTITNGTSVQIQVEVVGDNIVETDETYQVVISSDSLPGSTVGSGIFDDTGSGTVLNDDSYTVDIEASKSALEDEGPIAFDVTFSNPVEWAVDVAYIFNNGGGDTADLGGSPNDYTDGGVSPLSFATYDQSETITINFVNDSVLEPAETLTITLVNPTPATSGALGNALGSGTILNDDHGLTMSTTVNNDKGTVVTSYGGGASVGPTAPFTQNIYVAHDATPQFSISNTDSCYHIDDVQVNSASQGAISTYTFSPIANDTNTINADFAINEYNLTASQLGNHGSLTPSKTVDCDTSSHTFTATAESTVEMDFHISWFKIDGAAQPGAVGQTTWSYTFNNVIANHTVEVAFTQKIEITEVSPFGDISPAGDGEPALLEVDYDSDQSFTMSVYTSPLPIGYDHSNPAHNISDHHISDVLVDGVSEPGVQGSGLSTYTYEFEDISVDHSIEVLYTSLIDVSVTGPGQVMGSLFDNSGSSGTITGTDEVESGVDHVFTMIPDTGYHVGDIIVGDYDPYDGTYTSASIGKPELYTFPEVVDMDHSFDVVFAIDTFTVEPVSTFGIIYVTSAETVPAVAVQVNYNSDHSFFVDIDDPDHAVMGVLVDNTTYPLPTIGSSVTYTDFVLTNTADDYLEVKFTSVKASHRLEVQDFDKTPISDVPLDARLRPKPASLMFVLDDSGSMDWEFITPESNGLYNNDYYLYHYPDAAVAYNSNGYSMEYDNKHAAIKAQWTGYNKMFYNPDVTYAPWPTFDGTNPTSYLPATTPFADELAHANIYRPRYHPWRSVDCVNALLKADGTAPNADLSGCNDNNTFDMDESFLNFTDFDFANSQIVDNTDAGYSETGSWRTSSSSRDYGSNYRYAYANGGGTKTASWTVVPTVTGDHQVDVWYVRNNSRRTITYTVQCTNCGAGGISVNVYQRVGGTNWTESLGIFDFVAGETVTVTLTDNHQRRSSSSADAIRIVPVGDSIDIINAHYITFDDTDGDGEFNYTDTDNDNLLDQNETILDTLYLVNLKNPVEYYRIVNNTGVIDGSNLVKVDAASVPATVLTYAEPTDPDVWLKERQNWADWFSYYRKRIYAATAAVAQVIDRMSEVEVGYKTINYNNNGYENGGYGFSQSVLPVEVFGETDKTNRLLEIIYAFQVGSYGTPLRNGLKSVGQYYDDTDGSYGGVCNGYTGGGSCIASVSPYSTQEDGDECKQVFTVVMTDGFWNGGSPSVGNTDGNDGAPYADSAFNTLADVAMKYLEKDLSTMPDQVPDSVTWQHMVTYSVSFGVHGTLDPADYDFNAGVYPSWPTPSANSQRTIDDLWHAAVNGRGKWYSADRPDQLVNSLLSIMKDIGSRIGSGSAVSVNGDELYEEIGGNIRMFQTTYQSGAWFGDLKAFRLDVDKNEVLTGDPVWSAQDKLETLLDNSGHNGRVIATYDSGSGKPFHWLSGGAPSFSAMHQKQLEPYFSQTLSSENLVDFLRGDNTNSGIDFRDRTKPLGDFVHSLAKYEDGFLYVGSNDGMLHAFWAIDSEDKDNDNTLDAGIEDLDGDDHFDDVFEDQDGDCVLDNEDVDGDGHLDYAEDLDGDGHLDIAEDVDGDGFLDSEEDLDGDGHLDTINEDVDGDGNLDHAEDLDGDGNFDQYYEDLNADCILDPGEDLDGDGNLDVGEDINCNGILDPGEDKDGDNILDLNEDLDGDLSLDAGNEDLDGDGNLDSSNEDLDGDGNLDVEEDADGDGSLDPYNEDVDGDGSMDVDEDLDGDGVLDSEDLDGDGHLDVGEDTNCNGILDGGEDLDGDGFLDDTEDLDGDNNFDNEAEDLDNSGTISVGGEERFAYVPGLVYQNLRELANPLYEHKFYVDNTPYIERVSDSLTLLVGGLGKGGKGYFSLDITDPATITTESDLASRVKWEYPPVPGVLLSGTTFTFESGTGTGGDDVIRDSANGFTVFAVGDGFIVAGTSFNDGLDYGTNDGIFYIKKVDPGGSFIEVESGSLIEDYGDNQDIIITRSTTDKDMGYSYSRPIVFKSNDLSIGSGQLKSYVVLFGNGYESENGNAVLYVINPDDGSLIRKIDTKSGPFNGLSSISATDVNNDLRVDYVYVGDLLGNMWKFDLTSSSSVNWQVAYCDGADPTNHCRDAGAVAGITAKPLFSGVGTSQAITGAPDIMFKNGGPGYMVIFGTGKYLGTTDVESIAMQSLYGIWDWAHDDIDDGYLGARVDNTVPDPDVAQLTNWAQTEIDGTRTHTLLRQDFAFEGRVYEDAVSGDLTADDGGGLNTLLGYYRAPTNFDGNWDADLQTVSFDINKDGSVDVNDKYRYPVSHLGWYADLPGIIDLDGDSQDNDRDGQIDEDDDGDGTIDERKLGERVINDAIIRDNKAIIISFGVTGTRCNAGAYSFVNERWANNGGMPLQPIIDVNGDGEVDEKDRMLMQSSQDEDGDGDVDDDDEIPGNFGDKAHEGRLHNPTILREGGDDRKPEEVKFFSSSDGSIQTITEKAERRGVYFWQQAE